ncbi:MFS transporter [Sinorhizobium arboris]|uniref:MFS transporter n=1 Tax=Sinorhizobium arboris TaxID=76745 RepID=UPI00067F04F4|nr:MFS transporter [Sinorhizobium arboris]
MEAPLGVLAARAGYQRTLVGALLIGAICSLAQAMLPPISIVLPLRFIEGLSHLGIVVSAPTLMALDSAPQHRSIVMGLWGTFFGVAFALTAWIGAPLLNDYGLAAFLLAHAALMGVLLVCTLIMFGANVQFDGGFAETTYRLRQLLGESIGVFRNLRTSLAGFVFLFHTCMFVALLTFVPRLVEDTETAAFLLVALPLVTILGTFAAGGLAQYVVSPVVLAAVAYVAVGVGAVSFHAAISADEGVAMAALLLMLASGAVQGSAFAVIPFVANTSADQARAKRGGCSIGKPRRDHWTACFCFRRQRKRHARSLDRRSGALRPGVHADSLCGHAHAR